MSNDEILGLSNGFKLNTRMKRKTASTKQTEFFSSTELGVDASELFHDMETA